MNPVMLLRVAIGDETLQLPLYRLPYAGGQDSHGASGGFFTTSAGEFGIAIASGLSDDDAKKFVAAEIERAIPTLTTLVANRKSAASKLASSHTS